MPIRHRAVVVRSAALLFFLGACTESDPLTPASNSAAVASGHGADADFALGGVTVCQRNGSRAHPQHISRIALAAALQRGDHLVHFTVDPSEPSSADGTRFTRITDAIAAARAVRVARDEKESGDCRIVISVAPGMYRGSNEPSSDPTVEKLPLLIDAPDITLLGAGSLLPGEGGRASDRWVRDRQSILASTTPLVSAAQYSAPLVVVHGVPGGFRGNGAVVHGFTFESGHAGIGTDFGGLGLMSLGVDRLLVNGNQFGPGFSESIDLRESSGVVRSNHLGGGAGTCDLCLAGPGSYHAEANTLLAGGIPGILIVPAVGLPIPSELPPYVPPATSTVTAEVVNNEVRDHLRRPVGVGLRVGAIGVLAPNVIGTSIVTARKNILTNNTFGVIVEAAFPVNNTARRGDVRLMLDRNVITESCQNSMLVSLSRHTTGLGLANAPYLLDSMFDLELGGNVAWDDVWYSHPSGFGNMLVVDGVEIPNGTRRAYDPAKVCN